MRPRRGATSRGALLCGGLAAAMIASAMAVGLAPATASPAPRHAVRSAGGRAAASARAKSSHRPPIAITGGPAAGSTSSPDVTFSYRSSSAGASYRCALDGVGYAACPAPKRYTALGGGQHTFRVYALVGGVIGAPAKVTWTVTGAGPGLTGPTGTTGTR